MKVYRKSYDYKNSSDCGKYQTRVPGLLDRKKQLSYPNGAILLQNGEWHEVIDSPERNNAEVFPWIVILSPSFSIDSQSCLKVNSTWRYYKKVGESNK